MCVGIRPIDVASGEKIVALKPGDEITIRLGFGHPAKEKSATDIVVAVRGFSALTASGVKLACWDGTGVEKTGRHFEDGEYEVSAEALSILEEAEVVLGPTDPFL